MKRNYFLLLCFLLINQSSPAQWTLAGTAFSGTVRDIFFTNNDTGYAVGALGVISKTTDGGVSWTPQVSGVASDLRSVHFVNDTVGYVCGFAGVVLKTLNGGGTWILMNAGINGSDTLRALDFISADTGMAGASGGLLYKTTDGGITWSSVSLGITSDIIQVDMLDANIGYALSSTSSFDQGSVFKTTDGGATWMQVYFSTNIGFLGLAVANSNIVYAGGESQTIIKTTDGGGTWDTLYTGNFGERIRSGSALSGNVAFLVDDVGNVFSTEDGGATWNDTLLSGGLYSINFHNLVGYAGNFNGKIYTDTFQCTLPVAATVIIGPDSVCSGSTAQYSIDSVAGADSYSWFVPAGAVIDSGQGTTNISVTFGALAGQISVTSVNDACGDGGNILMTVVVNPLPAAATTIIGPDTVCSGSTEQYSIDSVAGADSYNWLVPSDAVIDSGQGTTQIHVTFGVLSGPIMVISESDLCGDGGNISKTIAVNPPPVAASAIMGPDSVCSGSSHQYSIDSVSGAEAYTWATPVDAVINSGQGTTQISVTFGIFSGQISVTSVNAVCGNGGSVSKTIVVSLPAAAATAIFGDDSVCSGSTQEYSVDSASGAEAYNWTVPADAVINSGQGTTQISVTFGVLSGPISVASVTGACGNGGSVSKDIVVNPSPSPAITFFNNILSSNEDVGNQWYFDGLPIGGATDSIYIPSENGIYYSVVTNNYGCSGTSNSIDVIGLGIHNTFVSSLVIFPNPAVDECMIYFPKIGGGKLKIMNAAGVTVLYENNLSGEVYKLNTAPLTSGIYLIRVYDRGNNLRATSRLVVQLR